VSASRKRYQLSLASKESSIGEKREKKREGGRFFRRTDSPFGTISEDGLFE